ncbi:MAG: hypothetical protein ACOYU3_01535 [Bacillota bacterium]
MRQKRLCLICVLIGLLLALGGCMQNDVQAEANSTPASEYEGFYSPEQQYFGGDPNQGTEEVNLKDIEMGQEGDITRLTLAFSLGSRYSDADEAQMTSVPPYKAYCLGTPSRFVLEISGIEYWDYKSKSNWKDNPLIRGCIKQIPMDYEPFDKESANAPMILYFQLNNAAAYRIQENGDKLAIELRPVKKTADDTKYYATADAFADYQEGKFDDSLGLTPVLCGDLSNTVMVSRAFETKEEAEEFMKQTANKLETLLPGKNAADIMDAIALKGNALPKYDEPGENALPPGPVVSVDGKPKILPVVMQGGMYLGTRPETGQLLFAKGAAASGAAQDNDAVYYLWLSGAHGEEPARLMRTEFAFISDAQFSNDGSLLAILETAASTGKNTLYVYDMQSGVLRDLYEEGLETEVNDYVWGSDANTLYAIGMNKGAQQLISIKLDEAEPGKAFTVIGDTGNNAGSLAYAKNKIYYAYFPENQDSGTGRIAEVDLEVANTKRDFAGGTDFSISADGRYMAVIENNAGEDVHAGDSASKTGCAVSILDMETGKTLVQTQSGFVINFVWGTDAQSLFCITNAQADAKTTGQTSFAYTLNMLDMRTSAMKPLLLSTVSAIQASKEEDTLFLIQDSFDASGKVVFETYALSLEGL